MRIKQFIIENFRNIRLAEISEPPDFMVICGGNGCGKTALLNALMSAKEHAGSYGSYPFDPRAVSANADMSTISLTLEFSENERNFVKEKWADDCPEEDVIVVQIVKGGQIKTRKRSQAANRLLSSYSRSVLKSPGFFEYIDANRPHTKKQLSTWNTSVLSDEQAKQTLAAVGQLKFQFIKEYLASLVMQDAQQMLASYRSGKLVCPDSLKEIKEFFNDFFAPMKLLDVRIDTSPFQYTIETPHGLIDLDDMSAGEKEVLNTYIRFHQLKPRGAVILFDEADAHLHPDLQRRYLDLLRKIGEGNQLWLTTHSPEMMIDAGTESLYTVLKQEVSADRNQLKRVTSTEELHEVLSEVMGSRGLVSFNQRIVFIEGAESSADREVYERLYPPGVHNVSFVPAGNSATVRKTAERVNHLLSASIEFQHYYSIVDGDLDRSVSAPPHNGRLFQLPVYHVENFLLDENLIFEVCTEMLGSQCPYTSPSDVECLLKEIVLQDVHMNPYTKALLEARVTKLASNAQDAIFKKEIPKVEFPTFDELQKQALELMQQALKDESWREKCKGREVLKAFCSKHQLTYKHFRNCLIAKMTTPPEGLNEIMKQILG